jgi:hypothetical protein
MVTIDGAASLTTPTGGGCIGPWLAALFLPQIAGCTKPWWRSRTMIVWTTGMQGEAVQLTLLSRVMSTWNSA